MYRPSWSLRGGRLDACLARLLKRPIRLLRLPVSGCGVSVAILLRGIATAAMAIPATAAILSINARFFLAFVLLRSLLWAAFATPPSPPPELPPDPPPELPPELPPDDPPELPPDDPPELPPDDPPELELPPELPPDPLEPPLLPEPAPAAGLCGWAPKIRFLSSSMSIWI